MVKNLLANAGDVGDVGSFPGSDAWVGKIPWRTAWQPIPVYWPGEFHGLYMYSSRGRKESDTTE